LTVPRHHANMTGTGGGMTDEQRAALEAIAGFRASALAYRVALEDNSKHESTAAALWADLLKARALHGRDSTAYSEAQSRSRAHAQCIADSRESKKAADEEMREAYAAAKRTVEAAVARAEFDAAQEPMFPGRKTPLHIVR